MLDQIKEKIQKLIIKYRQELETIAGQLEIENDDGHDEEFSTRQILLEKKGLLEEKIFKLAKARHNDIKVYKLSNQKDSIELIVVPQILVDPSKGLISQFSPLVTKLQNQKNGDEVTIGVDKYTLNELI